MTIDANVFVSALIPSDSNFNASVDFVNRVRSLRSDVYCPTLVLPECAGAVIRPTGDLPLARRVVASLQTLPGLQLVSLTEARAVEAMEIALRLRLRGADAVYVALAQEFGTLLITWDREMLTRGAQAVSVMTPADWLATHPTV